MCIIIKLWMSLAGTFCAAVLAYVAVGGLLSGWYNWREGFRRAIIDFIVGICEFILLGPIAVGLILGVVGLWL